jgi:hypothetical protein
VHALFCPPIPGCERDIEAELDGAALVAYVMAAWLPESDPEMQPVLDEHGMLVVDPDDDLPAPGPARGAPGPSADDGEPDPFNA